MSGVLDALRRAVEHGDLDALAPGYGRNAELDASLPGGRRRHQGRADIVAELARWWDGPAAEATFEAHVFERGAALWTDPAT
ncbi:MAG: hypothetical protein E6G41_07490 [Actinobacteria bacterium]|nr:MAG: hypothetical protein E6G41_07490 [Actinomycetota bacterium]